MRTAVPGLGFVVVLAACAPALFAAASASGTPPRDRGRARAAATYELPHQPPSATFVVIPPAPKVGETVTIVSTSSPGPGTTIASLEWDLSGNGSFTPGSGPSITTTFSTSGAHTVALRVTDADGMSSTSFQTIAVAARPEAPGSQPPAAKPMLMQPFPVVTIAGTLTRRGARVRVLSVLAPIGARVSVRCRGRSCPTRGPVVRKVPVRHSGALSGRIVFKRFERGLRAGARLEIEVTKSGQIGKYTRFTIRSGRPPKRTDLCLMPGVPRPVACPA